MHIFCGILILFTFSVNVQSEIQDAVCKPQFCGSQSQNFTKLCTSKMGTQTDRCCNFNGTIIGLDWSNCNASSFRPSKNLLDLEFVFMTGSGNSICLNHTLRGFTKLDYVELNSNCDCPGGNDAWSKAYIITVKRICRNQKNTCINEVYNCPDFSYCLPDGPGMRQCLCNATFHGYKCLREGTFPMTTFLIGWASSMVVVGASLLCNRQFFIRKGLASSRLLDSSSNPSLL